jgi:hypothetical protein
MKSTAFRARARLLLCLIFAPPLIAGCGGDEEGTAAAPTPPGGNRAPSVSNAPPTSALYGRQYVFAPAVTDADGDAVTFSINSLPGWATFDATSGRLHGTPGPGDIGSTASLTITASDGRGANTNIGPFTVNVVGTASGSATLSWAPPTQNSDGTPLTNLAAYRVYFGMNSDSLVNTLTINNPGVATFVVDQLTPATWYFGVTAVNSVGVESGFSNIGRKTVL